MILHTLATKGHDHAAGWVLGAGIFSWALGLNWASILAGTVNLLGMAAYLYLGLMERRSKAAQSLDQTRRLNELEIRLKELQVEEQERDMMPARRRALS
jgi:hypothetical protein